MDIDSRFSSVLYFHGLPGSSDELAFLESPHSVVLKILDPLDLEEFDRRSDASTPVTVIGFSLGAFSALKLAVARPDSIAELVLISPAGPLEMGPYLDQMAGAPVFKMARASSVAFAILTAAQALAAHAFPRFLLKQMFANSCDAEKALLQNPATVRYLTKGLKHALWDIAPLYRRTISEYVQPWETELSMVQCPCQVFHGELDDWVPIEMARALFDRLPAGSQFRVEEGLGHYSTLIKVLPSILSRATRVHEGPL